MGLPKTKEAEVLARDLEGNLPIEGFKRTSSVASLGEEGVSREKIKSL